MAAKKKGSGITREFLAGIGREGASPAKKKKKLRRLKGVDKGIIGRKVKRALGKGGTTGPITEREKKRKKVK